MGVNASNVPAPVSRTPALEAGIYPGFLIQVVDMGLQPRSFQGQDKEPAQLVGLTYELADEFMNDDDGEPKEDKPRWITETVNLFSLDQDKAKSTKRYLALDPTKKYGGDFAMLLGIPVNIHLVRDEKDNGKVYNNVSGLAPMREKEVKKVGEPVNEARLFDLDEPDMEVWDTLPQWLQDKIKSNLNFGGSDLEKLLKDKGEKAPAEKKAEAKETDDNPY